MSFLPSFSVEVNHTQLVRSSQQEVVPASQLDTMARQVTPLLPLSGQTPGFERCASAAMW